FRTALHTLINSGEKAAAPNTFAGIGSGAPGGEHDKSRQVTVFSSQSIRHPGAHARPAEAWTAGVHEQLRRRMVELIGVNSLQKSEFISCACYMRQMIRDPCAALSPLLEHRLRSQHFRNTADKGKALPIQKRLRASFAIKLLQFGFVV